MQTIYLDTATSGVVPVIYAKQNDVGRKFEIYLTESGVRKEIPRGCLFSVWYSGASGDGNYSHIGDRSAFLVSYNTIVVEMITKMLQAPGDGEMCVVMSGEDGTQIATWNIPYHCEAIPGENSELAEDYYSAFTETAVRAETAATKAKLEADRAEAATSERAGIFKVETGAEITIEDAEDNSVFHGLKLYGKSTQDGTPAPENPVDIVHAGDDGSIVVTVNDTQTLTALTPNGLPGLKVPSGGNYTDSTGQQWVCDEVDFTRGVYVQRVERIELKGTEPWAITGDNEYRAHIAYLPNALYDGVLCTHYKQADYLARSVHGTIIRGIGSNQIFICDETYGNDATAFANALAEKYASGNPVTVYCRKSAIEETPLTDEELEQYAALRTSAPTTTVSNNAGVGMEVSYYPPNAALPSSGGTVGGELNMAGSRITGLGEPIGDTDAVPKTYVSPPMLFDVEYLTNEMWNGNQIFAKLIDFGSLPVDASKSVTISNESIYAVGVEGFVDDRGNDPDVPVVYPLYLNSLGVGVYVGANSITVAKQGASSPYYAYFKVKYIKL